MWRPVFKIAGVNVPVPDNYSQTIADLSTEESGRSTADGKAHKNVIGVKTSIPFVWEHLDWATAAALCTAIDGKSKVTIEYIDVRYAYTMKSKTFYLGDRSAEPIQFDDDNRVFWKVSFDAIEV